MISVVMPSLNQAAFLPESVRSVFAQDVPELELVVMDGGSNDGTQRLLAEFASAYPNRMQWFSGPDDGPASAVNRAVRAARGSVIGWLNSDDLYTPGAIARALAAFEAQPDAVMVYGEGEHVDERGAHVAPYQTLPPDTPLDVWADGCPICQPTVFFRRDAFLALGGLDNSLRASFDYEFWLRMRAAHPGRIAQVPQVQAQSRLHSASITSRFRERVALEGLQVVRRHVGSPPIHWLRTHFNELCETHPFDSNLGLLARCIAVVDRARPWLDEQSVRELEAGLASDARMRLSDADFFIGVDADGWARAVCELRLRQRAEDPVGAIVVHGKHLLELDGPLVLDVVSPDGLWQSFELGANGPFEFEIPVAERAAGALLVYRIIARNPVVPAAAYGDSDDERLLAFKLSGCELRAA